MWLLKDQSGKIRYIKPGQTYNVGRKQADIILDNDSSISRAHATITMTLKEQTRTSEVSSTCVVKDANSKYGTVVIRNDVKMKVPATGLELEPNDLVQFGLQQHIFKAEYIPLVSVISRLSVEHKKKLKNIMDSIGGIVIDCYDDNCTHLTTTSATSTSKIISALIAGLPIVGLNYWMSVLNAINADEKLPDPDSFILPLQDKGFNFRLVSLKPNPLRKTLFQDKTFIFFSEKTYREYKKLIKDAGGKVELFRISSQNITQKLLADDVIIMQMTTESMTDEIEAFNTILYEELHKKKRRMISETEIPLAVIYVSLEKYCNPKFDFRELVIRKSSKEDKSEVLAMDTQDFLMAGPSTSGANISERILIPETEDFVHDSLISSANKGATSKLPMLPETQEVAYEDEVTLEINNKTSSVKARPEESKTKPVSSEIHKMEVEDNIVENSKDREKKAENEIFLANSQMAKLKTALEVANEEDFAVLGKKKKIVKRKHDVNDWKENQASRSGVKKSVKKAFDFDLDNIEIEEPREKIKKEITSQDRNQFKYDPTKNNKLFKKVYKNIPATRIALADMRVWRPNA